MNNEAISSARIAKTIFAIARQRCIRENVGNIQVAISMILDAGAELGFDKSFDESHEAVILFMESFMNGGSVETDESIVDAFTKAIYV